MVALYSVPISCWTAAWVKETYTLFCVIVFKIFTFINHNISIMLTKSSDTQTANSSMIICHNVLTKQGYYLYAFLEWK